MVVTGLGEEGVPRQLAADARLLTVTRQDDHLLRLRQDHLRQGPHHGVCVPARQIGTADRAGEEQVPRVHDRGHITIGVGDENRGAGRVSGGMPDTETQPCQLHIGLVRELSHVIGLGELQAPAGHLLEHDAGVTGDPGHRVGQQVSVSGMNVGRNVARLTHRGHRPHVVQVPVCHQHRDRLQPVLPDHLVDSRHGILPGVDHDALLPRTGGHDEAVRTPGAGGETCDQHTYQPIRDT